MIQELEPVPPLALTFLTCEAACSSLVLWRYRLSIFVGLLCITSACSTTRRGGGDDAVANDATPEQDGGIDAIDAHGTLSPEPADPVSPPCAGHLGFPGAPSIAIEAPQTFVIGDATGDGVQDIVYGSGSMVGVARGQGDGTFVEQELILTLPSVSALQIGDINGDTKPDVLAGNAQGTQVLLNDGAGGYALSSAYGDSASTLQVEVGDLNGDGRTDVVSGGRVRLNTGTSLGTAAAYGAAGRFAVRDLTGDGRPDIVVSGAASVDVLVNDGSGSFASAVSYPVPVGSAGGVGVGDFNEDGKLDVVVGRGTSVSELDVLLNQGSGALGAVQRFTVATTGLGPYSLAVADLDGDGHVDIGAGYTGETVVYFLRGDGTGQFVAATSMDAVGVPVAIGFGQLDGGGRADVVVMTTATLTPYLNTGTASLFDRPATYEIGFGSMVNVRSAHLIDTNDDSRLDIATLVSFTTFPPNSFGTTRLATGAGMFAAGVSNFAIDVLGFGSALADFDNDGRRDVFLFGGEAAPQAQAVMNLGTGSMSAKPAIAIPQVRPAFAIGDVNSDGWRDLLIGGNVSTMTNEVSFRRGLGDGRFAAGTTVFQTRSVYGVAIADLDRDGRQDLVVNHYSTQPRVDVLLGNGDGTFRPPAGIQYGPNSGRLAARDLNHDGNMDLVVHSSNGVSVLLGNGDGTLTPLQFMVVAAPNVAFADFDGDGDLDLAVAGRPFLGILLGNGDGTFRSPLYFPIESNDLSLGDVDGDGRVDIAIPGSERVSILSGRCL